MKYPTGKWSLVTNVESRGEKIEFSTLQVSQGKYEEGSVLIDEMPFYVGADIWELAYGSVLMTLNHPTLEQHPANQLWSEWRNTGS